MYTGELLNVESEHVDEIVILVKSGVLCYAVTACSFPGVLCARGVPLSNGHIWCE